MAEIVPYAIWAVLIITGASIVTIAAFGLRSLSWGNADTLTIVLTMIPLVIVGILGLIMGNWADAAVLGSLIALVLAAAALILSSFKGLFS